MQDQFLSGTKPYTYVRKTRFGEGDAHGQIYTPRITDYCMEASEDWFKDEVGIDWHESNTQDHIGTPVVHFFVDFKAPLLPGKDLEITVNVHNIGRSTVHINLQGYNHESQSAFVALFIFCFVDNRSNKSISIPDKYLKRINAYRERCAIEAP